MKERKLNFNANDDPTIVSDPDGTLLKAASKAYQEIQSTIGMCHNLLKDGQLTEGMKQNLLPLAEHHVQEFLTALGYEGILSQKNEERYAQIRSLNDENRELRRQLGEKISNEDARERLKILQGNFDNWWSEYGFGGNCEIDFRWHHANIKFSGMVFEMRKDGEFSKGKKSKTEYLNDLGFEIFDSTVIANDKSLSLLQNLICSKYPSAEICEIKKYLYHNVSLYKEITVWIRDYNDL